MDVVLDVKRLTVTFRTKRGTVRALSDVSFTLSREEIVVVIGESGSGKSVLAHALMGLLPLNATVCGEVYLQGEPLHEMSTKQLQRVRGRRMALIPQGAATALNPVRKIGSLLLEIAIARGLNKQTARRQLVRTFAELNLHYDDIAELYPHQLSGGMQQRVVNAASLLGRPDIVIADEPTFGLDEQLIETTAEQLLHIPQTGAALLVITHDLRLARRLGGYIAVVYGSYVVEWRRTENFFDEPKHPYSKALLRALPEGGLVPIPGISPELTALPQGCPFMPRCTERQLLCGERVPPLFLLLKDSGECRCRLYAEATSH